MSQETKREKFVRLAENRTNKILDTLQLLGNCSNQNAYEYSKKDIDKILNYNRSSSTSSVGRTYHIGDEVSIIAGPFSNFKGVIDKISYDLQKVQLSVMFFSRPTIISVDLNQIQK